MLINISKLFLPLYGLTFTKDELYAKIQDVAELNKHVLPKNMNFAQKLFEVLLGLRFLMKSGDSYVYLPPEESFPQEEPFPYYVTLEYVITDYSFNVGVKVNIHDENSQELIGYYVKDDPNFNNTFKCFSRGRSTYAIYATNQYELRIMEMPSCVDLDVSYQAEHLFVITDIYIPQDPTHTLPWSKFQGNFGFVAGHYKDEDSIDKIQYLDLIGIDSRVIAREDRFGYIELPRGVALADAVDLSNYDPFDKNLDRIHIAVRKPFSTARNIGQRERMKNLQILKWICQNKECHGSGDRVVNPSVIEQNKFRCHVCYETVYDVGGNFTYLYIQED